MSKPKVESITENRDRLIDKMNEKEKIFNKALSSSVKLSKIYSFDSDKELENHLFLLRMHEVLLESTYSQYKDSFQEYKEYYEQAYGEELPEYMGINLRDNTENFEAVNDELIKIRENINEFINKQKESE